MTYEELKAEAKRQGYNLIKAKPNIKMIPCICGRNSRSVWHSPEGYYLECRGCGKQSGIGVSERQAREMWNEMIADMRGE